MPTVAYDLIRQLFRYSLQLQRLHSGKGGSNAKVELDAGGDCVCLTLVKVDGIVGGLNDMTSTSG